MYHLKLVKIQNEFGFRAMFTVCFPRMNIKLTNNSKKAQGNTEGHLILKQKGFLELLIDGCGMPISLTSATAKCWLSRQAFRQQRTKKRGSTYFESWGGLESQTWLVSCEVQTTAGSPC